jgi:predicted DNA-binding helix-hairpin-helix protein
MKHFKGQRVFIFGYYLKSGLSKASYETCEEMSNE